MSLLEYFSDQLVCIIESDMDDSSRFTQKALRKVRLIEVFKESGGAQA
jgi:hypothetical protein